MQKSLKAKLRALRIEKGWSLDKLAEEAQISKSYLWELENREKKSPSAEKLKKIAEALGVTFEFLLNDRMQEPDDVVIKEAFFRKFDQLAESDQKRIKEIVDSWSTTNGST